MVDYMINTLELERAAAPHCIDNTLPHLGVFASDQLPDPLTPQQRESGFALIANTDPSTGGGTHWVAMVQPPRQPTRLLFIEPTGYPLHLTNTHLRRWIVKSTGYNLRRVETLPFPIQPILTRSCGAYCLFLIEHLPLYNYNLETLVRSEFDEADLEWNQRRALTWWYKRRDNAD